MTVLSVRSVSFLPSNTSIHELVYTKHYRSYPEAKGSSAAYEVLHRTENDFMHFCCTSYISKYLFLTVMMMRMIIFSFFPHIHNCMFPFCDDSSIVGLAYAKLYASPIMSLFPPNIYKELTQNHSTLFLQCLVE